MEIKLGDLRVDLSAAALYQNWTGPAYARYIQNIEMPKPFYKWNCQTGSGLPAPRPANRTYNTHLFIHMPGRDGMPDQISESLMLHMLLGDANLKDAPALDRALMAAIAPLTVPVDWASLVDPYTADYAMDVYEKVTYLRFVARPYGIAAFSHFYLFVPHLVTFDSRVTGRCGGIKPDGSVLTGWSPHIEPGEVLDQLERQNSREETEANQRRQRLEESGGAPPSGSPNEDTDPSDDPENH